MNNNINTDKLLEELSAIKNVLLEISEEDPFQNFFDNINQGLGVFNGLFDALENTNKLIIGQVTVPCPKRWAKKLFSRHRTALVSN